MTLNGRRLAFVLASLDVGGAERQALLLAARLRQDHGAEVAVFGMGTGGLVVDHCARAGLPCTTLPRVESRFALRARWRMRAAMAIVSGFAPDVLLPFTAPANLACSLMRDRSGASITVWNQRDEGLGYAPERLVRAGLTRSQAWIANGPGSAAYLVARGIADADIMRLPNAVELPAARMTRDGWRQQLAAGHGDVVVTMLANLSGAKDHRTLIDAWPRLRLAHGRPILVLAGRDDGCGDALRAQVAQLGISASVRFLGAVDDVAGLLLATDVAVLSSRSEGCPNAVLEAMASGCAVVGSDIPGIAALIDPACLATVGDSAALAATLTSVAGDLQARHAVAARNQARARSDFSPAALTQRLADCIGSLLPRPGPT